RDLRQGRPRHLRGARPEGPLQEGARRRDTAVHRHLRPLRAARGRRARGRYRRPRRRALGRAHRRLRARQIPAQGGLRDRDAACLARDGYLAVTPALFDRVRPGIELGYGPEDIEKGRNIRGEVKLDDTLLDLEAAIDQAGKSGLKVGIVGYCWGGGLAFIA